MHRRAVLTIALLSVACTTEPELPELSLQAPEILPDRGPEYAKDQLGAQGVPDAAASSNMEFTRV